MQNFQNKPYPIQVHLHLCSIFSWASMLDLFWAFLGLRLNIGLVLSGSEK